MFRWLLKPRFYSKCISYSKFIRMRLETIQKKRRAVQKFTKGDIAELLRRGRDYDAFIRAERLLFEQNVLACYELFEKFIGCISDHLEDLTKQRDCPDECKEAVPSLMYAAARISDLPELRDLRTLFTEKYGNSLEPYISKELVEKLRRDHPSREMKIRLLYDIAQEFSIEWDAKALKQRLYTYPSLYEEWPKADNNTDNVACGGEHTDGSDDETSTDTSSSHGRKASSSSFGSVSEDEVETKRPVSSYWRVPPPYLKQKTNKGESNLKKTTDSETLQRKEANQYLHEPVEIKEKTTPRSTRKRRVKSIGGGQESQDSVSDPKTYDAATLDSGGMKQGNGKAYPSQQPEYDTGQSRRRATSHVRRQSLPIEPTTAVETSEPKGHTRAISLDSQMRGGAWRAHPNLPDYDDVVARLASLRVRGRS